MVLLHISVFFCKWWKIAALFSFIHKYKKLHLYAFNECWSGFLLEERNLWLKVCFDAAGQISLSTLLIESLDIPQGYFLFKLFQKCVCVKIVVWTHTSFHYIHTYNIQICTFKFPVLFRLNIQEKVINLQVFRSAFRMPTSRSYPRHLVQFCEGILPPF